MEIKTESQLQKILENAVREILEDITKQLLESLQQQILKDVYTTPNTWYHDGTGSPTMQFLNAWDWDAIKKSGNKLVTELYMHKDMLTYDQETWLHGSPLWGDARDYLDDILNLVYNGYEAGYTSGLMIWGNGNRHLSHRRRPYWSNFIKKWFDKGRLDKLIERKLNSKFGGQVTAKATTPSRNSYF